MNASLEVERSVWALDGAVLVVCAVEGVQPQTEVLFECLRQQRIPVLFFLNKLDRAGADPDGVLAQIKRLLTPGAVPADDPDAVTEALCDLDDVLAERYLSGEDLSPALIREKLSAHAKLGRLFPVLCGSALRDEGVGKVMTDINTMRGETVDSFADGERMILNARIPVATSLDYASALASLTSDRGSMSVRLDDYRECPLVLGATTPRRSVDPLDTSKYILAARSALEGGIFNLE